MESKLPVSEKTHIELPAKGKFLKPALKFIESFAEEMGIDNDRLDKLKSATQAAIQALINNSASSIAEETIGLNVSESHGLLTVEVINHGLPIFLNNRESAFHIASQSLDKVSLENHGRLGQSIVLGLSLGEEAAKKSLEALGYQKPIKSEPKDIKIREIMPGEELALSQLFYIVYGYKYINEFVYYPEKIKTLLDEKKLISIVAVDSENRLLGHVGLLRWKENPTVYEPCLGIVDPRVKSRGIFGDLFSKTMECVQTIPMNYCFFDFVTNHDYSQRFVAKYNPRDMALLVGCQTKETQARLERLGIGEDSNEMDRFSLLYSIIPKVQYPFGKQIQLPNNLGEMLGFLLKPLNIIWSPSSRFEAISSEGEYQTHLQPAQNAVIFKLKKTGRKAVEQIIREWQNLLRNGYQYAGVEVPVDQPGLGNVYDLLAANGFFVAGFLPEDNSDRLTLRFQSIGPTKVAFDDIKVFTPIAKKLLKVVRENYEKNTVL